MSEELPPPSVIDALAGTLVLGAFLDDVRARFGSFELLDHWTQGEFHHDVVVRVLEVTKDLPGRVLVCATNCNGGVKEVLCFAEPPTRESVWAMRCPGNAEFSATPAEPLARSSTLHWFDPCELLAPGARSELRPEHRVRQRGGGWVAKDDAKRSVCSRRRDRT